MKVVYLLLFLSVASFAEQKKATSTFNQKLKMYVRVKNCKSVKLANGEKTMYCEKLEEPKK